MTGSEQSEILRRKFSLTGHHDDLLDEIVEQRYASRSEALRAAIQHHARYISDGGETDIESLGAQIEEIGDEIELLQEKLDDRNSVVHIGGEVANSVEAESQTQTDSEVEDLIAAELSEEGALSINEITDQIDKNVTRVIPAKDSLVEKEIVRTSEADENKYELNT